MKGFRIRVRILAVIGLATLSVFAGYLYKVTDVDFGKRADSIAVAVVNSEQITYQDLANEALFRHGKQVLNDMINRRLIMQACEKKQIKVTESQVNEEIEKSAKKEQMSVEQFLQYTEETTGISPAEYKEEIVFSLLSLRSLVDDAIDASPEEVDKAYAHKYGDAIKYRIIVTSNRSEADHLRNHAIKTPTSFPDLAKAHSLDKISATVGGIMPTLRRYSLDPPIEEMIFSLAENEISEVFQDGNMWLFLQVVRKLPPTPPASDKLPMVVQELENAIRAGKTAKAVTEQFAQLQASGNIVIVFGNPEFESQYPGVAAIVNGEKISEDTLSRHCVKLRGRKVLDGEIDRLLLSQALRDSNLAIDPKEVDHAYASTARSFGYADRDLQSDESSTQDNQAELYKKDVVWRKVALRKLVQDDFAVTDQEIQNSYIANFGERAHVMKVVLRKEHIARKIWTMARENPTDDYFADLATLYSTELDSKNNAGRVAPIRHFSGDPTLEKEAFALSPGELSQIIPVENQYVILRCLGFSEPQDVDLSDVKDDLVKDAKEKKLRLAMARKLNHLRKTAQIETFLPRLNPVSHTDPETQIAFR